MKYPTLAELPAEEGIDRLIGMTPYLGNILTDEALTNALTADPPKENQPMTRAMVMATGMKRMNALLPVLLKTHREDIYGLLSAYYAIPITELQGESYGALVSRIKNIINDESITAFFT